MATILNPELLDEADRLLLPRVQEIPTGSHGLRPSSICIDERKLLIAALEQPYDGNNPAKAGLTKMAATAQAVANQAAEGIPWAVEFVFNRLYGRPKQTIATANLQMTLKEYLTHLSNESPIHQAEIIQ